jgi:dTDP-3-amino-3,4,6-trideoxy-alpha-D-glucose transaminase
VANAAAFSMGDELEAFESDFARYCVTPYAVGVGSGTDALALVLRALGLGPGDEVIVPANSFIATAEAVSLVGAVPRLVDVDPDTALLTAAIVEANLAPRVRCVIPVHLFGRTVDLDPIMALARDAGVAVVEDACQAHGALYKGRRVGTIGEAGCFSFYPAKNLGAWGDGGAVVTADAALADRVRLLRSHGERPRYRHRVCGTTSRLDALQAALLRVKLRRLDRSNDARRRVAASLTEALAGAPDVRPPAPAGPGADHVFHLYVARSSKRNELRARLDEEGVATGIHYPTPIHLTEAYAHLGMTPGSLPMAERLARSSLSLPLFPSMSEDEVARVADAVGSLAGYAAPASAAV